jgi:glycosyltransferase involved in cell wall biosynthesis
VKRRILFVVNADWFFVSHRLQLARALRDHGYEVAVCAGRSDASRQIQAEGFEFFPLPIDRGGTHPVRDARTFTSLLQLYRRYRPSLVHHVTIKPVLYGSLAARAANVPAVVNAISGLGYVFIPRAEDRLQNRALRGTLRAAYRVALSGKRTRVIFQNTEDLETFVTQKLVSRHVSRLIRGSGVDLEHFAPQPFPEGPFLALMPSRLLWDKGVGEFVEAARTLRARHPAARFVLVGRLDFGNPAAVPAAQVDAWLAEGVIEWWPERSRSEMPSVYGQAHVVVLPSYREGLPLALAEAAATGRAVVTTDVPGCRDTVLHGQTGWAVKPRSAAALAEALDRCITTADLKRIGAAGRQLAETRFGLDQVIDSTLAAYTEILAPLSGER